MTMIKDWLSLICGGGGLIVLIILILKSNFTKWACLDLRNHFKLRQFLLKKNDTWPVNGVGEFRFQEAYAFYSILARGMAS